MQQYHALSYVSAAVKLTDDPAHNASGTWMQVEGYEPVRYGSAAGSVVMFLSRRPHRSMRTPINMGKVLKLVLFFKFVDDKLKTGYESVAPRALVHEGPCRPSILPPQVRRETTLGPAQSSKQHLVNSSPPTSKHPLPPPTHTNTHTSCDLSCAFIRRLPTLLRQTSIFS